MNRETRLDRSDTLVVVDRSRRNRNLAVGAIVAVVVLVLAYLLMSDSKKGGEGNSAAAANASGKRGQIPTVTVVVPGRTQVGRVVSATGAIAALRDQPVGAAGTGGRVTAVLVDAGQWVNAGQTLARVDRSVQTQTAAQLAAAVDSARASAALAQANYDRANSLVGRGFISKAEVDSRRAARDQAQAQIRLAQAQLAATRAGIGLLDIKAPNSGLVLQRNLEVGQVIGAGSQGLFRIAQGGTMEMRAQVSQQDLAAIRVGMPATVTPIGAQRGVAGRVRLVAPVIDPTSRLGDVRVAIPYSNDIRPGGFADAKITAGATTAPVLPQSAVLSDADGNYVYVVNGKNEVEHRAIKIGEVSDAGVTIAEGLSGTEAVVLQAGPFLNPGQKVTPRREAAAR